MWTNHHVFLFIDCSKLILNFKKFKIRHVFRKANEVEAALAEEVVRMDGPFTIILNSSSNVLPLILFDGIGKLTLN